MPIAQDRARCRLNATLSRVELEALSLTTAVATAEAADRICQDTAHEEAEQERLDLTSLEAGRRRREAAELDHALVRDPDHSYDPCAEATSDSTALAEG